MRVNFYLHLALNSDVHLDLGLHLDLHLDLSLHLDLHLNVGCGRQANARTARIPPAESCKLRQDAADV